MRDEQSTRNRDPIVSEWPGGGTWGTMDVLANGHLAVGGCDTVELAKTYGTPLFVYDEAWMRQRIHDIVSATQKSNLKVRVSYASKAFCTIAMCQLVHEEGLGLDVVSGGELYTALAAGVPASEIHMHGNNKSWAELEYAVSSGIGLIIVDNFVELDMLNQVAENVGHQVDILLRISPGVEAHTHEFISTGQQDSKFGFDLESGQAAEALRILGEYRHLRCVGLHSHIGSQIFEPQGFTAAVVRMVELFKVGIDLGVPLRILNLGGGYGIRYTSNDMPLEFEVYMDAIESALVAACGERGMKLPEIWLEPGRVIAGPPGTTLYTVGTQKSVPDVRNYVAVDGGMTDNPRLALYGAEYDAVLANRMNQTANDASSAAASNGASDSSHADESSAVMMWRSSAANEATANEETDPRFKDAAKGLRNRSTAELKLGRWSVAGKCCESGDMLIWDAVLPHPTPGDIMAVFSTGAYNYSMASHYNRTPKPAVVFVADGRARVVVERETWADMVRQDRFLR